MRERKKISQTLLQTTQLAAMFFLHANLYNSQVPYEEVKGSPLNIPNSILARHWPGIM